MTFIKQKRLKSSGRDNKKSTVNHKLVYIFLSCYKKKKIKKAHTLLLKSKSLPIKTEKTEISFFLKLIHFQIFNEYIKLLVVEY